MSNLSVPRSMVIGMLNVVQMETLHVRESQIGRCLVPWEMKKVLGLDSINSHWSIPDDAKSQEKHNARIHSELIRSGCYIEVGGLFATDNVDSTHTFDQNVWAAKNRLTLSFEYQGNSRSSKKIVEELTRE